MSSVVKSAAPVVGGALGGPAGAAIAGGLTSSALGGGTAGVLGGGQVASSLFTADQIKEAAKRKASGIREGSEVTAAGALEGSGITAGALDTAQGQFQPFTVGGGEAAELEAALSGALGPEAQQAAIGAQAERPFTQFVRQQGQRSIDQGFAAGGGLGGGARQKAQIEFGQGLATSTLADQLQNLRQVRRAGTQASTNIADLIGRAGGIRGAGVSTAAATRGGGIADAAGARAQGQLSAAEQIQTGIEGLTSTFALKDKLNRGGV